MTVPLVPGELRGFRQFLLRDDGLYPAVHWGAGAWGPGLQRAECSRGGEHEPPDRACTCGFYGWYDPSGTAGSYGGANAVVEVSGRIVLGDRGFRAARARITAVALPLPLRWQPRGAARTRRMLAARYPDVRVYDSVRQMVRDHPPQDVSGLGIGPLDRTPLRCRRAALLLWALFLVCAYGLLLLPRDAVAEAAQTWWPLALTVLIGWQALVVRLVIRSQPESGSLGAERD